MPEETYKLLCELYAFYQILSSYKFENIKTKVDKQCFPNLKTLYWL